MNGKKKGWFKKKGSGVVTYAGRWDGLNANDFITVDSPPGVSSSHFYEMYINLYRVVSGSQYFIGLDKDGVDYGRTSEEARKTLLNKFNK